jgi:hypothetical protein
MSIVGESPATDTPTESQLVNNTAQLSVKVDELAKTLNEIAGTNEHGNYFVNLETGQVLVGRQLSGEQLLGPFCTAELAAEAFGNPTSTAQVTTCTHD